MSIPKIAPYAMPGAHEIPDSAVGWIINPGRAVLVIHDLQRYFVSAFYHDADPFLTLIRNIRLLLDTARAASIPVVYTVQPFGQSSSQRGLLRDVWGMGIPDDEQAGIFEECAPRPEDEVVTRTRYNAFLDSSLDDVLVRLDRDQLIVAGVYAHIGCQITAVHAFMTEREVFTVADAQADFSREHHEGAMEWLAGRASRVTVTAEVVGTLRGLPA